MEIQFPRPGLLMLIATVLAITPLVSSAQSPVLAAGSSDEGVTTEARRQPDPAYMPPTQKTRVNNYLFDAFGPYPIAGAAIAAGVNQLTDSPPAWHQGFEGYAKRFGSDFGIVAVGTTTRYGLARALREDTLYYRCECTGFLPRISYAMLSTFTSRRGADGHRVFSIPSLLAPYAGTMTAVYGWYPGRYGAKDAFRMGNYNLLAYMGGNITLEFFYSGPHSLLSRLHLNNPHGAPDPGPNQSGLTQTGLTKSATTQSGPDH